MGQPDRDEPRRWSLMGVVDWQPTQSDDPDPPLKIRADGPELAKGERIEVVESREPFPSDEDAWDREDFVQAIRAELARGTYQTPGELLPYEDNARAIAAVIAELFGVSGAGEARELREALVGLVAAASSNVFKDKALADAAAVLEKWPRP